MSIDIAVVPVAGLGTRLLPATKSQPKEMLPVGRKPVVQYVCEELARDGLRRILFITDPGKTSLENHFDVNEELVQLLRESGKEELLTSLEFERAEVQYFYTRQRYALGLGHAVLAARYVLSPDIFQALDATQPGVGGELQLTDAIRRLIHEGGRAYDVVLGPDERLFDIGNFDAYFRAFVEFSLADPKHGPSLRAFVERLVR